MKRNIFTIEEIKEIQQGCIFSGANADNFDDCDVFGLIITPRCDIAHGKVHTLHYLPIVSFKDWKIRELSKIYQFKEIGKRRNDIINKMGKYNFPEELINSDITLNEDQLLAICESPDSDKTKNFIKELIDFWKLRDLEYCSEQLNTWSNYNSYLNDLANGKIERFLLLEHWETNSQEYFVIFLSELHRVSYTTSKQLIKGIKANSVNPEKDDMHFIDDSVNGRKTIYRVLAQLASPYIEYVCQRFSNAFFRIGIEDWSDRKAVVNMLNKLH